MPIRSALSRLARTLRGEPSRRSNSLDNPSVPLSAAGFLAWAMGSEPTASGEQVTLNTALQQETVYACVRVLGESVASLPVYVYQLSAAGRQVAADHPLSYLLRWAPNDEMTAFTLFEAMVGSMALTGNGYAQIQRDAGGRPVALWPLHPQLTNPMRAPNGDLVYQTSDGMADGEVRTLSAWDVLHVPLFSFNGLRGLSPIHLARQGIGLARASEKYGARFFGNGARPGGVLSSAGTLTDKQKAEIRESWNQTQGGENQGAVAVLPGNWTYHQIGISPDDSQFLETRAFQRAAIAALFRVPPHMVGDTTRLSNNNHEQMSLSFVTDTLRPYLCRLESEIVRKLLPQATGASEFTVEFDVSERLRGDFATTMAGYATGKQWGWLNTNDIRKEMNLNPVGPVGDVYFAPVNMQNAERLLDTESIQDQPLQAHPAPGADEGDPGPSAPPLAPGPGERKLLARYTRLYVAAWRDAFGRLLRREHRDLATVSLHLRPVLDSIAEHAMDLHGSAELAPDSAVRDVLRGIAQRAAKWQAAPEADALAQQEFLRAVRALHITIGRELAAESASREVAKETGNG